MKKKDLIREICSYSENKNSFSLTILSMELEKKSKKELEKIWNDSALAYSEKLKKNKKG